MANLFETGYGQLLLVKIAMVGLLLFLAGYNRFLLMPGLFSAAASASPDGLAIGWQRLASTVRLEALGMVAARRHRGVGQRDTEQRGKYASPRSVHEMQSFDGGHVTLHITPNAALVNDWTVH